MLSPWLFNVYMDGVVREVNARVQCWVREWRINQLLFVESSWFSTLHVSLTVLEMGPTY